MKEKAEPEKDDLAAKDDSPGDASPGDASPAAGRSGFVERSRIVAQIHRHLNFSILGLSLLAIPVGIAGGYGAWAFRLAFGRLGVWIQHEFQVLGGWFPIAVLGGAGLLFGLVLQLLGWERFRGPAHVIVANSENDGKLGLRDGFVTVVADALALSLAAPVGRYGPAVYFGATIGSLFGQWTRLGPTSVRILLGCGVAAGISGGFNAPIAGAIFAHEVILGHFRLRAFAPITLASVAAVAVTRFHHVEYVGMKLWSAPHPVTLDDYPWFLLMGFLLAFIAIVYMSGIMGATRVAGAIRLPKWTQPMVGGAVAGLVFLAVPEVMGLGDEIFLDVLEQDQDRPSFGVLALLVLAVAKLVASVGCLGLRYPGGTFTPAMFIGAMLGGVFGILVPAIDYQISVLAGMGALVGAVVGAPLSVILIVFELTENYQAATAVMVAVVAANAAVTRFFSRSLFHRQIRFWGIEIDRPEEQRILARRRVGEILRRHVVTVPHDGTVADLKKLFGRNPGSDIFVIDPAESLVGVVTEGDCAELPEDTPAEKLAREPEVLVSRTESLWGGFEKLEASGARYATVVDTEGERTLVGIAPMAEFLAAYRAAVKESRREDSPS